MLPLPPRPSHFVQRTLAARRVDAPEGSYTARLFNDAALLRNKVRPPRVWG